MITKNSNIWLPAIIAALGASLCCIAPLIAFLGGIGGLVTAFSWIEPARPYLIGFTITVFVVAWYNQFRRNKVRNCECEVQPVSFWDSQKFLLGITIVSALLMAFPYYASALYQGSHPAMLTRKAQNIDMKRVQLTVKGMSCADCTKHIDGVLSKVPGVVAVSTSFEKTLTTINYKHKKVSAESLKNSINKIGYQVTSVVSK